MAIKTFIEVFSEGCASHPFRDLLDNSTDDEIIESVERYADQFRYKWIPVSERLPETHDDCIVYNSITGKVYQANTNPVYPGFHSWDEGTYSFDEITHWMPLPEPPTK